MSFQNECAYLPSDLLDSDDEVAQPTTKTQNNSFSKLYDDMSEAKTADNSSNSGSSTEMSSIFSVEPFKQCSEDFIVGWKCSACGNFNTKKTESCRSCEKDRVITEDLDVTKRERRGL